LQLDSGPAPENAGWAVFSGRRAVQQIDVFNGDADGLCALHQFRLAHPLQTELVSGVKRDVNLLARVKAGTGDRVTVFDISLRSNRTDVDRLLASGAHVQYFDHHDAGEWPASDLFTGHIDTAADVCTSIIVDRSIGGRHRAWAVAAAFGDNLHDSAIALAQRAGLGEREQQVLMNLGQCLNYNGYGDRIEDLHFDPVALYRAMSRFDSPFEFASRSPEVATLGQAMAADLHWLQGLLPSVENAVCRIYILRDAAQSRRVTGLLANRIALERPSLAHAVLTPNSRGTYTVSVRAPIADPCRAQDICRAFGGGGREAAAGINDLPDHLIDNFAQAMSAHFSRPQPPCPAPP
jgi:hypothetical protein